MCIMPQFVCVFSHLIITFHIVTFSHHLGAITPTKCPLGYRQKDDARQVTFDNTCEICPSGSYGNHPDRAYCTVCQAGVVCLEGATTDTPDDNSTFHGVNFTNSYPCPVGKFV